MGISTSSQSSPVKRNELIRILEKYPDKDYNYDRLSMNANMTFDYVLKNTNKPWNWRDLSRFLPITVKDVVDNLDLPWNYKYLSMNDNIKLKDVLYYISCVDDPLLITKDNGNDDKYHQLLFKPWSWRYLFEKELPTYDFFKKSSDKSNFRTVMESEGLNPIITMINILNKIIPLKDNEYKSIYSGISLNKNFDFDLLLKYPDLPWNYFRLSFNRSNLKLSVISKLKDKDWNWTVIPERINIDIPGNNIEDYLDLPWDWEYMHKVKSDVINLDFVLKHIDQKWSWGGLLLHRNKIITYDFVLRTLNELSDYVKWNNWHALSEFVNFESIVETPSEFRRYLQWDWARMSLNTTITFDFVFYFIDKPWSFSLLSKHPKLNIDVILKRPQLPWRWKQLSVHKNIKFEDMINNRHLPWDWSIVPYNPNVTYNDIKSNPDINWNWGAVTNGLYKELNIDIVINELGDKNLDELTITSKMNIKDNSEDIDVFLRKYKKAADFGLSGNPYLTEEVITNHPEIKWSWSSISNNEFGNKYERIAYIFGHDCRH